MSNLAAQAPVQNPAAQDPLQNLKDIHLPDAISDFPIAWGWWVLLILIIAGICASVFFFIKYRKNNAVKRSALVLLKQYYEQYQDDKNSQQFLHNSNQILKRYCLTHYPQAVSLSGTKWTHFLICYSQKTHFSPELINAISTGIYQKECQYNADELYSTLTSWLKNNKSFVITPEQENLNV